MAGTLPKMLHIMEEIIEVIETNDLEKLKIIKAEIQSIKNDGTLMTLKRCLDNEKSKQRK